MTGKQLQAFHCLISTRIGESRSELSTLHFITSAHCLLLIAILKGQFPKLYSQSSALTLQPIEASPTGSGNAKDLEELSSASTSCGSSAVSSCSSEGDPKLVRVIQQLQDLKTSQKKTIPKKNEQVIAKKSMKRSDVNVDPPSSERPVDTSTPIQKKTKRVEMMTEKENKYEIPSHAARFFM